MAGTITFLFGDLEGSTRLLNKLGERYAGVLADHRNILRNAIREFNGRELDTAGDGIFVAFQRARDAAAAAAAVQRAMSAATWPDGVDVRVRVGLHTGEPVWSAEGYVGLDVHRAARICSAASGGQVLLSLSTHNLIQHELPEGVTLRDLGMHRLKDLGEPEHLFQLVIAGVRSEFPPPRTLGAGLHNFPALTGRLIGRERDIDSVRSLLMRDDVRLVTLTGPGGTGKTRLSIAAAEAAAGSFEHGACFVPLAALSDPQLVPAAIANAFGIPESPLRSTAEEIAEHVRPRRLLLVLDNFEQIVSAAPVMADLLSRCANLKLLVTSRVVLHLRGEHEYPVAPLALPLSSESGTAVALGRYPAVALFVERARAVRPDFDLDDENGRAVRELCIRLDGLPLALELAAARIRLFSPQALLARLGRSLDLLKGGARDLPERHQTLRQAIAWSYELLDPAEQALFRRLSVFMGGFTIEAAEAVCEAAGRLDVDAFEGIGALVERSLLKREPEVDGEPRFGMLETVREFGFERLEAHGEVAATRSAHAQFFVEQLEAMAPRLTGPEQVRWLNRIEADHDNVRAAITGLEERGDADTAMRLCSAIWRFCIVRGHMREGRSMMERVLAMPDAARPTVARARALMGLSTLMHETGEYQRARPMLEESLAIWRELEDTQGIAIATTNLGWVASLTGEMPIATNLSEEGLSLHRLRNDRRGMALALNNLGWADLSRGDLRKAREHYQESQALLQELGDNRSASYLGISLAWVERLEGKYESASGRIDEALLALAMLRDRQITGYGLWNLACIAFDLGDHERAWKLLLEGLPLWSAVGNFFGLNWNLCSMVDVAYELNDPTRAPTLSEEHLRECERTTSFRARLLAYQATGLLRIMAGDIAHGALLLARAVEESDRIQDVFPGIAALENLVHIAATREPFLAAQLLGTTDAARQRIGAPRPPRVVRRLESSLIDLHAALDAAAFEAAHEEGWRRSFGESGRAVRAIMAAAVA
jgi:predicted ATPase/class 3 adenylate cyclase